MKTQSVIHIWGLGLPLASGEYHIPEALRSSVEQADILIGGKRQLALFPNFTGRTVAITSCMEPVFAHIEEGRKAGKVLVALTSGDPLFFGLGARIIERFGPSGCVVYPHVSSLQGACAMAGVPWDSATPVSLHGRESLLPLAHGLLRGRPVLALLDNANTPERIAAFMEDRGYGNWRVRIYEHIHWDALKKQYQAEVVTDGTACAQDLWQTCSPVRAAVMLAQPPHGDAVDSCPMLGIPDAAFAKENGLITKGPVRAVALANLGLKPGSCVWDLGAGSGAVSIEAACVAREGAVFAVEKNAARIPQIQQNRKRFGVAHLEIVHADAIQAVNDLPVPQAVFVGGGLGLDSTSAANLLVRTWERLAPGGTLVVSCVLLSSLEVARAVFAEKGVTLDVVLVQASQSSPLGGDIRFEAHSPVFLLCAKKVCEER